MINLLAVKAQKWLKLDKVKGMPYRYNIDPMNICNLKCPVCPTGLGTLGRDRGKMHFEDYKRIVDQIAEYAYVLELYNWGEPLLHSRIFDMINYAHQRRISVRLSSNLNHFNQKMAEQMVASGLDRIIVSVDGSTQETYEKYRRGGNLSRVLNNVRILVEEKKRQRSPYPFILLRMLVNKYNEHQVEEMRQIAHQLDVDAFSTGGFFIDTTDPSQVKEWLPTDESQSFYDYDADRMENVWHCSDLWESMAVNWDGGVAPCCWLHQKENDFENALEKPVAEIWNGDAYTSSRRVFAFGGPKDGPRKTICTVCKGRPMYLKD
jgi:MoaA/NifB/PqqE/SkfB family radical SAM enzyme